MLNRIAGWLGYVLVDKKNGPREIALAFADEMEWHLDIDERCKIIYKASSADALELISSSVGSLKVLVTMFRDDMVTPDEVRFRASLISVYMLYLADNFGELGNESMIRNRLTAGSK